MEAKSIFEEATREELIVRIEKLQTDSQPKWGEMNITEMMAHCSLAFEYNNGQRQTKVNPVMKFLLRPMMRNVILGEKPYKKNSPTASYFKVFNTEEFAFEKERLVNNVKNYSNAGSQSAESLEHVWLGKLSGDDWSWLMYKHLNHHLVQFGV